MTDPVGVTGTQEGLTKEQFTAAEFLIKFLNISTLHHGDCIGADEQLDNIARNVGLNRSIHPPKNDSKRAYCHLNHEGMFNKFTLFPEKEYLDRNHDIVDDSELILAFPKGFSEELRSGTWATVRYAIKQGRLVLVVFPDGSMTIL